MNNRASLWNTSDKLVKSASCKFLPQSGNPVIFKTLFLQKVIIGFMSKIKKGNMLKWKNQLLQFVHNCTAKIG